VGSIHYETWTPAAVPSRAVVPSRVVVIVHGYAEYAARYEELATALTLDGAVVYGPDHMGHGHSAGERALITDFEQVVDDLRAMVGLALAEHPGLPVVMVGHSMGGLLAARFAQRFPGQLAGIVFLGAVIGDWTWAREVLALPELPEGASDHTGMSRDPVEAKRYADDPLIYHGSYKRPLLEAEVVALDRFGEQLDRLTMPLLFCHGTDDPFVSYQTSLAAVEAMPSEDKTVRLYQGARHELVHETNRDEVIAEIAAFVRRAA
jgi:alpha-beta hydrolase superfamily lysophospholipase